MDAYFHTNFRVRDVYDLAKDIVAEFEQIADTCGSEAVRPLVIKVITALEQLEDCIIKLDLAEKEISNLNCQNNQLKSKKIANDEDKLKLEQDLEQVEESWKLEMEHLKVMITRLQADNKQLQNMLDDKNFLQQNIDSVSDQSRISDLKVAVTTLSNKLKEKDNELDEYASINECLNMKLDHLSEINENLRYQLNEMQTKLEKLCSEKQELKFQVDNQEKVIKLMEENLEKVTQQQDLVNDPLQKHAASVSEEELEQKDEVPNDSPDIIILNLQQQCEISQRKIYDLEEKLTAVQKQSEMYEKKMIELTKLKQQSTRRYFHGLFGIRQLFHLFLGIDSKSFRHTCS